MSHALVLATSNRGKLEEFRALLVGLDVHLLTIEEVLRHPPNIVEDGRTFADNAAKKARTIAEASMMLTLADDSGLEVDALEGRPGVRSARFAHARATDAENNAALLAALEALGDPALGAAPEACPARFRCALAVVDPYGNDGEPVIVEGVCEGRITRSPRGTAGFGYDPLFVLTERDKTMAELSLEEKNSLSHRAKAVALLRPVLESLLAARNEAAERISRL